MDGFKTVVESLKSQIYLPNGFKVEDLVEEGQNADYYGCKFKLNGRLVRFRVAKITPNKLGQFVSFWEKDNENKNIAYDYEQSPDLVIVTCFTSEKLGQFVFTKDILLKKKILKNGEDKGKMGIRVYPSWDVATSPQAKNTQKWQLEYFVDLSDLNEKTILKLKDLYD